MLRVIAILLLATSPAVAEPKRPRCDAAKLQEEATGLINMGQPVPAYFKLEAAAKCLPSEQVHELAAYAACTIYRHDRSEGWARRAKLWIAKLPPAKQQRAQQRCVGGCGGPSAEWTRGADR